MWVVGVVLLLIVLGFGVTGYLLPWTVISKSATDVAIGIMGFLPGSLGTFVKSLISGTGSDNAELQRFFAIHTVVLPWALTAFLALKIYMFEVHGPSYIPAYGKAKKSTIWPWFPKIFLYAVKIIAVFIAIMFAVASIFPLILAPQFNPQTAGLYVVQPDWYLLSLYQVFKFRVFEGPALSYALGIVALLLAVLILLPFYDRSKRRSPGSRPVFTTLGLIGLTEFIVLTVWGYLTPGQQIPTNEAVAVTGIAAFAVLLVSWIVYRTMRRKMVQTLIPGLRPTQTAKSPTTLKIKLETTLGLRRYKRFTGLFIVFLIVASVSLASLVHLLTNMLGNLAFISTAFAGFAISMSCMIWMMKRAVLAYEKEGVAR
jgi:quinol-cytochrome oxidoreductase complex cytochrome b subunit